uniref:Glycosyltransferase n=1 Tax=Rubia yunnanensis TaxID=1650721 RepID=A0A896APH5_9GENT|nr:glycosyltransferase [Rubia yunnanensis]
MEKLENSSINFKVLMLPWLAHGHISPYLQLARKLGLTNKNCHIYLCSTQVNLDFVRKSFHNILSNHAIELVELHLAETLDLPPHYHTTKDLPPHLVPKLIQAFQSAKSSFATILDTLTPDLLIFDAFQSWAPAMAAERNIPAVYFIPLGAAAYAFLYHSLKCSSGTPFPFSTIFLSEYEQMKHETLVKSNKEFMEFSPVRGFELSSEIVLIKTCREIEEKYVKHLSFLCGKELVTTGPLSQESNTIDHGESNIMNFLNGKAESSVVLVNFGSECYLSDEEREEIAHGLELSKVEFIWVIRFPSDQRIAIKDAVPEGFLKRVKNRGIVVDGWAPQAEILEHKSVGGFMSHCGWGSVMESLCSGIPIIAIPMKFEQPLNARLVAEIGAGLEVVRDENGKMKREKIASAIKMVIFEKFGNDMREKN